MHPHVVDVPLVYQRIFEVAGGYTPARGGVFLRQGGRDCSPKAVETQKVTAKAGSKRSLRRTLLRFG